MKETTFKIKKQGAVEFVHCQGYGVVGNSEAVCFYIDTVERAYVNSSMNSEAGCPILFLSSSNPAFEDDTEIEFVDFPGWGFHGGGGGKSVAISLIRNVVNVPQANPPPPTDTLGLVPQSCKIPGNPDRRDQGEKPLQCGIKDCLRSEFIDRLGLPPISEGDRELFHYNPNTSDIVEWVQIYAIYALSVERNRIIGLCRSLMPAEGVIRHTLLDLEESILNPQKIPPGVLHPDNKAADPYLL